ncbi:hypothetical protein [Cerasicoccus arenae]|uniref:Uncharacterized protein n=1 Tax=Cerasicoccus arenae TaxID=424488 RepID=A0A8J3DKS4_9BACT|nr:hypothetical protein [Cerasicoccus arenae]MBK1859922.1 hypothetical protein [Cerasicoccus arenae]GHC12977.1 hypothetical protein GCM10007047_32950 [Cerasicoccus arenae]
MADKDDSKRTAGQYSAIGIITVFAALLIYLLSFPFAIRLCVLYDWGFDYIELVYKPLEIIEGSPLEGPYVWYLKKTAPDIFTIAP